eukprot:8129625-Ditylum_brightwellii.AAC.1
MSLNPPSIYGTLQDLNESDDESVSDLTFGRQSIRDSQYFDLKDAEDIPLRSFDTKSSTDINSSDFKTVSPDKVDQNDRIAFM